METVPVSIFLDFEGFASCFCVALISSFIVGVIAFVRRRTRRLIQSVGSDIG